MNAPLRFRMPPQDDLASRADFPFEVMQQMGKILEEEISGLPEIEALRAKAKVRIRFTGTLRDVRIHMDVLPGPGGEPAEEEKSAASRAVSLHIGNAVSERLDEILQKSIDRARERM